MEELTSDNGEGIQAQALVVVIMVLLPTMVEVLARMDWQ